MKTTELPLSNDTARLPAKHYKEMMIVCEVRRSLRCGRCMSEIIELIKQDFKSQLEPYLVAVETMLLKLLPQDNALRLHAEKQHAELRAIVHTMSTDSGTTSNLPEAFADLLEENIRFGERMLFPQVRNMRG